MDRDDRETYESMLLAEDLARNRSIHCLHCHAEVGRIGFLGQRADDEVEERQRIVSLAVDGQRAQGVVGSRSYVRFRCEDCSRTSIYYLLLGS